MDEELEQSNQKINVDSFFQSLQPVNELAQAAMAQSEVTFSLAQQNSQLIQAVQSSLIDVQSGVSEITNYIIVQQKQKTKQLDKLADDIVAQQDKQQKGGKSKADQLKDDLPFAEDKKKTGKSNLVKSLGDVANQAVAGANSQLGSLAALGLLGAGSKLFKEKKKYNLGGQVSGSGNADTVPAMLTPGEFVISKDAVNQVGVDALKNINAAAGSTSEPTPYFEASIGREDARDFKSNVITESFFDTGKGRSSDSYEIKGSDGATIFSHKADMIGSSISESYYDHYSNTETYDDGTDKTTETFTETETSTSKSVDIGVPDLIEHKDQLLGEIHKIKGFENVTIQDVLQGRTGLDDNTLFNILANSDASYATAAKKDAAAEMDFKARGFDKLVDAEGNLTKGYSTYGKLANTDKWYEDEGDKVSQSLKGTVGYRSGQLNPASLFSNFSSYKSNAKKEYEVKGYNQGGLVESVSKPQVKSNDLTPPDDDMGVQILPPISQTVGGSDNQSTSPPFTASSIEAESIGETVSSVNFIDVISNPYLSLA
tara:strand:+ start:1628 stop:3253 length:1626 start_codon:yes stop_codon:yes gene_type:complete